MIALSLLIGTIVNGGVLSHLDDAIKAIKGSLHVADEVPKPIKKGAEEGVQNSPQMPNQQMSTEVNAYIALQGSKALKHCIEKNKSDTVTQQSCNNKINSFQICLKNSPNIESEIEKNIDKCKKINNL